jgi:hypothetical protein
MTTLARFPIRKSEAPAGDVTMEVDGEGDIEGETKEQKKARKEAKKQVSDVASLQSPSHRLIFMLHLSGQGARQGIRRPFDVDRRNSRDPCSKPVRVKRSRRGQEGEEEQEETGERGRRRCRGQRRQGKEEEEEEQGLVDPWCLFFRPHLPPLSHTRLLSLCPGDHTGKRRVVVARSFCPALSCPFVPL